jgi:hypothetical protein
VAVIVAVMAMALLAALGAGLVLVTSVDARITGNFRASVEARYAAAAVAEVARVQLARETSWDNVLSGVVRSGFADGLPVGERVLAGGTRVDLSRVVNLARCGRATTCTAAEMNESTSRRPWGVNNPHWQVYAYGSYEALTGTPPGPLSSMYVIALVGDDGLETDGDSMRDGGGTDNPGGDVLLIRAVAFGASGAYAAIETTVGRRDGDGVRVLSWRQL